MTRTKRVVVMATPEEYGTLKKEAQACGLSVSSYMRYRALYKDRLKSK